MLQFPLDNFRRPAALLRFFLTMLVGLGLDLWTKHLAFARLGVYSATGRLRDTYIYHVIDGYLELAVTTNHGAVFGVGEGRLTLFIIVSIAAIFFLAYLFANSRPGLYQFILGMLLAGVLGNMHDRVVYGYVRDMIHVLPRWPRLFPWIFNVADMLLCTGVGLMVLYSFIAGRQDDRPSDKAFSVPEQEPHR